MPWRSSSRSSRSWPASARVVASWWRSRSISSSSSPTRGFGPADPSRASASSIRRRSTITFSSRRSASSSWTSESAGFFGSFDIAAESGLELAQAQVLHLAAKISRLDGEALDALQILVREAVQLARVDEQADREPLPVLLEHVLVAGDSAAGDLHLLESVHPA